MSYLRLDPDPYFKVTTQSRSLSATAELFVSEVLIAYMQEEEETKEERKERGGDG